MRSNNAHTAMQLPLFHERRVVGKALFGIDTEALSSDFKVLSGLNTFAFKPFNLIVETNSDAGKIFSRDSRLCLFFFYDAVI